MAGLKNLAKLFAAMSKMKVFALQDVRTYNRPEGWTLTTDYMISLLLIWIKKGHTKVTHCL